MFGKFCHKQKHVGWCSLKIQHMFQMQLIVIYERRLMFLDFNKINANKKLRMPLVRVLVPRVVFFSVSIVEIFYMVFQFLMDR